MRSRQASFKEAIRTNPKLSTTLALELGLLCYAALKARTGKFAGVPPAATIIDAVPAVAAAVLAAPVIAQPKKRSRRLALRHADHCEDVLTGRANLGDETN